MKLEIFKNAAVLQKFCVDNTVGLADIAEIVECDGMWYLFYY